MYNQERWNTFIAELRTYVEEHHLGPSKHTALYNQCRYYRKKLKEGSLDTEKARELEEVLSLRDLSIHTGGRKNYNHKYNIGNCVEVSGSMFADIKF